MTTPSKAADLDGADREAPAGKHKVDADGVSN
jgi:hypothetical protein